MKQKKYNVKMKIGEAIMFTSEQVNAANERINKKMEKASRDFKRKQAQSLINARKIIL